MYAVIRAGGKQYRVTPGDVIKVEKPSADLEFEVLAFSDNGKISRPQNAEDAHVKGELLAEGREKKILVFHYKRKKQYKKLNGHRQPFASVRITEIGFEGQTHKAAELAPKAKKAAPAKKAAKKTASKKAEKSE